MKLWLLKPRDDLEEGNDPWEPWYDKAHGFVVRANDESQARRMAEGNAGKETRGLMDPATSVRMSVGCIWTNPDYATCEPLGDDGPPGIVLRDFRYA